MSEKSDLSEMKFLKYIFITLLLVLALLVISIFQLPDSNLHIIACDVGQGDATLMVYRNVQILVDGGPDKKVLSCLGKHLPFWDRNLELVILTHPDSDHFMGLIDVFKRYKVENYLENRISVSKLEYKVLENLVGTSHPTILYPDAGMVLRLGMIHLDILSPSEQLSINNFQFSNRKQVSEGEVNHLSIVSLISFGNFKALLTGDMPPEVSDRLSALSEVEGVNYIKTPHHGSKNGLTENLLKAVEAKVAVISVGKKNQWGFPNPEILEMLKKYNVRVLRTDETGDVEVVTDGKSFWIKTK